MKRLLMQRSTSPCWMTAAALTVPHSVSTGTPTTAAIRPQCEAISSNASSQSSINVVLHNRSRAGVPLRACSAKTTEIGALGLGPLDGADDFRLVPFNVADRIIQLSKSDFHLSGILIFQYILCKGNDYLEKLARFLLKYAARRLALRRNSGSHGTGCRQHADTAPCKPPRNPAVRPSATAASRPAIGGKKTCSRPAATAPEARPAGHRKKREVPPRKRRNLRYIPLPDYSSAPSGSATRIRPQYSQMMIFLP